MPPEIADSNSDRPSSLLPGTAERVRLLIEDSFGPGYWDGFQGYVCEDLPWHEWRFGGQLGFGGKVHLSGGRLYVSAYPEDTTYLLRKRIDKLNERLARVLAEMGPTSDENGDPNAG